MNPFNPQKDLELGRKEEALASKADECNKKEDELKRLLEKLKQLESNVADLEISLTSASEKAASLEKAKKKLDTEIKRKLFVCYNQVGMSSFEINFN